MYIYYDKKMKRGIRIYYSISLRIWIRKLMVLHLKPLRVIFSLSLSLSLSLSMTVSPVSLGSPTFSLILLFSLLKLYLILTLFFFLSFCEYFLYFILPILFPSPSFILTSFRINIFHIPSFLLYLL